MCLQANLQEQGAAEEGGQSEQTHPGVRRFIFLNKLYFQIEFSQFYSFFLSPFEVIFLKFFRPKYRLGKIFWRIFRPYIWAQGHKKF